MCLAETPLQVPRVMNLFKVVMSKWVWTTDVVEVMVMVAVFFLPDCITRYICNKYPNPKETIRGYKDFSVYARSNKNVVSPFLAPNKR